MIVHQLPSVSRLAMVIMVKVILVIFDFGLGHLLTIYINNIFIL